MPLHYVYALLGAATDGCGRQGRKGESMSAHHETPDRKPQVFVSLKEAKPTPRPEETDAEIEAWVMEQLLADKKTLDLLATL